VPPIPQSSSVPNQLAKRDPELVRRLTSFREQVNDVLLDRIAAQVLHDPDYPAEQSCNPTADLRAAVLILRVLTKDKWDQHDMRIWDVCWRQAISFDAFADEFEAERHRIQHAIEAARKQFAARVPEPTLW
jgi:hypothetical protein